MALSSNWQELSVDDAADLVAARVTVVGLRTKQAADQPGMFGQMVPPAGKTLDWLNPLKDPMAEGGPNAVNKVTNKSEVDPFWGTARSGVVGAGIGAGLGGLQALMTPSRKRRWLHSLLSGALMGGGVGLGAGAAMNYGGQAAQKNPQQQRESLTAQLTAANARAANARTSQERAAAQLEGQRARLELDGLNTRLPENAAPTTLAPAAPDPTAAPRTMDDRADAISLATGKPATTGGILGEAAKDTARTAANSWTGRGAAGGTVLGGVAGNRVHSWLQQARPPKGLNQAKAGIRQGLRRTGKGGLIGGLLGTLLGGAADLTQGKLSTPGLPAIGGPHVNANGQAEFIPNW